MDSIDSKHSYLGPLAVFTFRPSPLPSSSCCAALLSGISSVSVVSE